MDAERLWILKASFAVLGVTFVFFVIARPMLSFPMLYDEIVRVLQIIVPVFGGYIGIGAAYVSQVNRPAAATAAAPNPHERDILRLLLRAPVYGAAVGMVVLIGAFWWSNRHDAAPGGGMSIDNFCWFLALLMGVLAASTSLIVTRLFPGASAQSEKPKPH